MSSMQSTSGIPEETYILTEVIARIAKIIARRRWWILSSGSSIPIAIVTLAMALPNRYVSQATLLLIQQEVSSRYVESDNNATIAGAIEAARLQVLSRARLRGIINDLTLYPEITERTPERLVDRMRKDIQIEPLETSPGRNDANAFTIAFTASNPKLAQQVTTRLTSLFIEQNVRSNGRRATETTRFLNDQLAAAKRKLDEQEARLRAFKTDNLGELPEQQQANLEGLMEIRQRMETIAGNRFQVQQQRLSLEVSLSDHLSRLQAEKGSLLSRYTPRYPEVIRKEREIERVQSALEHLKTGTPGVAKQNTDSGDDLALDGILRQAEANAAQITTLAQQEERLKAESEQYQKRLNMAPLREQQLAEIVRDDNLYKENYTNLLNKTLQSQMVTNLEENHEGQQFRLVDPPSLPAAPTGPPRLKICLGGLAAGILGGFALAFLMDNLDSSFHDAKTLGKDFPLPFVIGVPRVRTRQESRLRRLRIAFEWLAGIVIMTATLSAEFYVLRNG